MREWAYPPMRQRCPAMDVDRRSELQQLHASLCHALADPTRLFILEELRNGPRTVSELVAALGTSQEKNHNGRGPSPPFTERDPFGPARTTAASAGTSRRQRSPAPTRAGPCS